MILLGKKCLNFTEWQTDWRTDGIVCLRWHPSSIVSHVGFYIACIEGLGVQIVPGRMWCDRRLSPLISLHPREILPKIRHVGTDYNDIRAFHCQDQRRSNKPQMAGTYPQTVASPVSIWDGLLQHYVYDPYNLPSHPYRVLVAVPNPISGRNLVRL